MKLKIKSMSHLKKILSENDIDFSKYGKGDTKPLRSLYEEVRNGESILSLKKGKLRRDIGAVELNVFYKDPKTKRNLKLFESKQVYSNGRIVRRKNQFSAAEKMYPGENPMAAAKRALREELGIRSKTSCTLVRKYMKNKESRSYPGLFGSFELYRFKVLLNEEQFSPKGYSEKQRYKTVYFIWKKVR